MATPLPSLRLVGRNLSPFVRRVAVSMNVLGLPYLQEELIPLGEGKDRLRAANPVTRVPLLMVGDESAPDEPETLIDSATILDALDEMVGPDAALIPPSGADRRAVLKLTAVGVGVAEKAVTGMYEWRLRSEDKWHQPVADAAAVQARDGLRWLDAQLGEQRFLFGDRLTQADITAIVAYEYLRIANPELHADLNTPALAAAAAAAETTPPFSSAHPGVTYDKPAWAIANPL